MMELWHCLWNNENTDRQFVIVEVAAVVMDRRDGQPFVVEYYYELLEMAVRANRL